MELSSTVIANQHVALLNREGHVLGPDLVLRECDVVVKCAARSLTLTHTTFDACDVTIHKSLQDFSWFGARFEHCTFRGELVGNRFGRLPEEPLDDYGNVSNSSFVSAVLHLVDFLNVDLSTVELPRWPCFTVLNPAGRTDLLELEWPDRVRLQMEVFVESSPDTTGITAHAPAVVRQFGGDVAELKHLLESVPGVTL